ncbi:MAG: hypothetical protein HYU52_00670 [Acidobacteria bacterium]|nr:hypothetical protein [Acidobacteriota bacterium]
MKVYKIGFSKGFSVLSEETDLIKPQMFDGRSLQASWREPRVRVEQLSRGDVDTDYPFLAYGAIVVSTEAMDELVRCLSLDDVERLPLSCAPNQDGYTYEYELLNVTRTVDCLDLKRSRVTTVAGKVIRVDKYFLDTTRLRGVSLFRLPQLPYVSLFTTEEGARCFKDLRREGLEFREVFSD